MRLHKKRGGLHNHSGARFRFKEFPVGGLKQKRVPVQVLNHGSASVPPHMRRSYDGGSSGDAFSLSRNLSGV